MADETKKIDYGQEILSWKIPEFEKHERTKIWYIAACAIGMLLLIYAFFTGNFLFAVIIVIVTLVIILHDGKEPEKINFSVTDEGLIVGRKFYDYDEMKDFSIIYKPNQEVKNLYFEFKNVIKPRLSIPLMDTNPLSIRKFLLKYLTEDLERTDQPLSESLAKLFKL